MATSAASLTLAAQARRIYTEELVEGLVEVQRTLGNAARELLSKPSEHATAQKRRDLAK